MSSSFQSNQLNDTSPAHVPCVSSTDCGKLVLSISNAGVDQIPVEATERNVTIGSADDCTVSLCADLISPHAIRITRGRQRAFAYALCPETQLNGKTFTREWLKTGDRISCGSYDFEVRTVDPWMAETRESDSLNPMPTAQPTGIGETELRKLKEHTARLRAKLEQQRQQLLEGNHEVEADFRESLEHLRRSRERLVALTVEAQAAPKQTEVETGSTPRPVTTEHTSFNEACDATTETKTECCDTNPCDSPCGQSAIEENTLEQYNLLVEETTPVQDPTEPREEEIADQAECLANPPACEVVDVPAEVETNSLKEWFNAEEDSTEEPTDLLEERIDEEDKTIDLSYETVIEIEESDCCSNEVEVAEACEAETVNEAAEETLQREYDKLVEAATFDPPKSPLPQQILDIIQSDKQEFGASWPEDSVPETEASEEPGPFAAPIETDVFAGAANEAAEDSTARNDVTDATRNCQKETDDQEVERLLQEVIREHDSSRSDASDEEECAGETFFSHIESESDEAEARLNQRIQLPTFTRIRDGLSNFFGNSNSDTPAESEELSTASASQDVSPDEFPEDNQPPEVSPLSIEHKPAIETKPVEEVANEEPASFEEQVLQTEDLILDQVLEQPETMNDVLTQDIPEQDKELDRVEQLSSENRGSHMNKIQLETSESENFDAVVTTDATDAAEPNDQADVEQECFEPQSLTYEQIKQSMMEGYEEKDSELPEPAAETETPSTVQTMTELQNSGATTSSTDNDDAEEQEESVEAYMERLLNRTAVSKRSAQTEATNSAPTETEQKVEVEVKSVLKETFSEQLANRQEVLKPVEISPQSLPKLETNYLDEMRNMSRESAKSAIEESFRRKTSTTATVQLGLACCCLLGGLIQTVLAKGFTTSAALMAIPFYIAAAVLFYLYNNWRRSCHKVGGPGAIEANSTDEKNESGESEK